MRAESVAANYAAALFALGEKHGQTERFAGMIESVAAAVRDLPVAEAVLMSPRITKAAKGAVLARALPEAPREFVLFLQAVVNRGRQGLFGEIAIAYRKLLDRKFDRVRAVVTVARHPSDEVKEALARELNRVVGKEVIAEYLVDPEMLGGVIVRIEDRVFDGSVRRRMTRLRRQLLAH